MNLLLISFYKRIKSKMKMNKIYKNKNKDIIKYQMIINNKFKIQNNKKFNKMKNFKIKIYN